MAIVTIPKLLYPEATLFSNLGSALPTSLSTIALDASGEKAALVFRASKTGSIRKIGFFFNVLTTPTDTDFRVETVSAGYPTGTLYGANTNGSIASGSLSAATMNMATLTSDAAVTVNDLVAIVCAPSGSPNVTLRQMQTGPRNQLPYGASYLSAAWATLTSAPVAAVEYSDGSYALIPGVLPASAAGNTHTFNSSSTPDEVGAKFRVPVTMRVAGGWLVIDIDNDCQVVLYGSDGVTALATSTTLTSDGRASANGTGPYCFQFPSSVTISANTYYYLAVKPGASSISLYSWDVLSAAALDQMPGGQDWHYVSAKDPSGTGSWTAVTTRYPLMGLLIDGIDDGAAAKPNIFDSAIIRAVHP